MTHHLRVFSPQVLVGAGASILGNVKIGEAAKIGASALVLTDIPAHATAVGSPAKVGPASTTMQCIIVSFLSIFLPFLPVGRRRRTF
jgi:carbonic anhydrase/acetyltransferase-like protein (isoleucine patch superfamily)